MLCTICTINQMRMEAEAKERLSAACSFSSTTCSSCSFLPNCPTTTCSFDNSGRHCQGEGRPSHDQARDGHENTSLPHPGPHNSDHPLSYPRGGNAFLSAVFLLLLLLPAGLAQQNLIPEQGDPPLNNITNLLIVISRFPCCVLLALSWNTAGGGNCV